MTFINLSVMGRKATTKELEKLDQIKVYDCIIVSLVKSNENEIVITGDD